MCLRVAVVAAGRVKMNRSTVNYHEQTRREQRKKRNPSRCRAKIFTPKNSGNDISGNCAECWRITNPSCARAERAPLRLVFTGRNTPRRPVMRSGGKFIVIFFCQLALCWSPHTHYGEELEFLPGSSAPVMSSTTWAPGSGDAVRRWCVSEAAASECGKQRLPEDSWSKYNTLLQQAGSYLFIYAVVTQTLNKKILIAIITNNIYGYIRFYKTHLKKWHKIQYILHSIPSINRVIQQTTTTLVKRK